MPSHHQRGHQTHSGSENSPNVDRMRTSQRQQSLSSVLAAYVSLKTNDLPVLFSFLFLYNDVSSTTATFFY